MSASGVSGGSPSPLGTSPNPSSSSLSKTPLKSSGDTTLPSRDTCLNTARSCASVSCVMPSHLSPSNSSPACSSPRFRVSNRRNRSVGHRFRDTIASFTRLTVARTASCENSSAVMKSFATGSSCHGFFARRLHARTCVYH